MGTAENKQRIADFVKNLPAGTADWSLMAEDADWWIQGRDTISKAEIRQIAAEIAALTETGEMFIDHVTAEEDRVAVESHSRIAMLDGRLFENTYHFLFILRDGKIVSAREHFDTAYALDFFGGAL